MATIKKSSKKEIEVEEIVSRSEQFIEKNSRKLIYGVLAIAIVVAAILGIQHGYLAPRENTANAALFKGEQYFLQGNYDMALNGNGADYEGFEAVISNYGGTKAGNLAKAYAGICYYQSGENEKAIEMLQSFKTRDNIISPSIIGLVGDCYVNMDKTKEGISYFEKAAKAANNSIVSPVYLKKAGIAYESLKQYNDAVKAYTAIKEKYYNSDEANGIEKYITRATALAK